MRKTFILFLLALFYPLIIFAATTGKIGGRIVDKESGEPLAGVNILIEDTYWGAASDLDGFYFILNIPPSTYTLKAEMIGYEIVRNTNVVVSIDRTTTIDFELQTSSLELGEVIEVIAEKEAVRKDVSFTQSVLGNDALYQTPNVANLQDALTKQVGVLTGVKGPVIRGGWIEEIGSYVDGVSMRDSRTMGTFLSINKSAIGEVQMLTGGFSAEYGDARSGIINIVTKEPPKNEYNISFEGRFSPSQQKHFGPYVYSKDNWWGYGRFQYMEAIAEPLEVPDTLESGHIIRNKWRNEYGEDIDRDNNGYADFEGWNKWAEDRTFLYKGKQYKLTPQEAYDVWKWQHRVQEEGEEIPGLPGKIASEDLNKYAHLPDWQYDFTITGPLIPGNSNIPVLGKTGILVSHRNTFTMYPFYVPDNGFRENSTLIKLQYIPSPKLKIEILGTYNDINDVTEGKRYGNDLFPGPGGERFMSDPQGLGGLHIRWYHDKGLAYNGYGTYSQYNLIRNSIALSISHVLSPKTFYDVKISRTYTDTNIKPFKSRSSDIQKVLYTAAGDTLVLDAAPVGSIDPFQYERGITGFDISGGGKGYDWSELTQWRAAFSITSQIDRINQVKAGGEFNYTDILDLRGNLEHPENHDPSIWLQNDVANWDTLGMLQDFNYYNVYPIYGALYIQDKIEYRSLILNLGLRLDIFDATDKYLNRSNIWHPYLTEAKKDSIYTLMGKGDSNPPTIMKLSPRLGASFPIMENTKLFFNYGHFYSLPPAEMMYRITNYGTGLPIYRIGYPWIDLPRTIQYEFGFEWGILREFMFNTSAYYKDITGDFHETEYINTPAWDPPLCKRASNEIARVLKGLELKLEKRAGRFITGSISYDLVDGDMKLYWYRVKFNPEATDADPRIATIYEPHWARKWPARQSAKINLNFHTPSKWGPVFLGFQPFSNWRLNILHDWRKGRPYVWRPDEPDPQKTLRQFNRETKDYNRTDLSLAKSFDIGKIQTTIYLEISNLFNVKNMFYSFTEQERPERKAWEAPGFDGDRSKWLFEQYMEAIDKEGKKLGDDVSNPELNPVWTLGSYEPPRHFTFGFRFNL